MSIIEKVKEHYGNDLPGKTEFRNDPENPCTLQEVYKEFKFWDVFVAEYNKPAAKPKTSSTPAVKAGDKNEKSK